MSLFPRDRLRPKPADGVVILLLLAATLFLFLSLRSPSGDGLAAIVTLDGTELVRQPLSSLTRSQSFSVPGVKYPVTIEFAPGRVRIAHTHCPGGDCAAVGWVSRPGGQIVCLPNRLSVSVIGIHPPEVDAVAG